MIQYNVANSNVLIALVILFQWTVCLADSKGGKGGRQDVIAVGTLLRARRGAARRSVWVVGRPPYTSPASPHHTDALGSAVNTVNVDC